MKSLRSLSAYVKPYWWAALLAPLLMALEVAMDLAQPRLTQRIVDVGIARQDLSLVLHTGVWMILAATVGAVGGIGCTIFAVIASFRTGADLRDSLFRKVQSFSFGNLDQVGTGSLIPRLTNDVGQIQEALLMLLRILVRVPLLALGSLVMAILTDPVLALLLLVMAPLLVATLLIISRRAQPLFTQVQAQLDRVNTVLQENLAGVRLVKAFVRTPFETQRFGAANNDLMDITVQASFLVATTMPFMMLFLNLGTAGAVWWGGVRVQQGHMQVGQIIAFINYLLQMLFSLMMMSMLLMRLVRAEASAARVREVLEVQPLISDPPGAIANLTVRGQVEFDHVTFSYSGEAQDPVLREISFRVEPGETVALLGATGSGKSTLVHLLPRFYDVTGGRILLDGIDIREIALPELRRHIALAMQETLLFSGTIRDNIAYGRPEAPEEEIIAAARAAQAHDFIMALPDGYDTQLGQQGVNLSGGQKQRLAIARALVVRPAILILDDSTSAVDLETEARLQAALAELPGTTTCFIIAQRISAVFKADLILLLDEGRLVAQGKHAELLKSCALYRDIVHSQRGTREVIDG